MRDQTTTLPLLVTPKQWLAMTPNAEKTSHYTLWFPGLWLGLQPSNVAGELSYN
jgi:hypothetical protein